MNLITGAQIRMARAFLRMSVSELSEKSGVGTTTIKRMEKQDDIPDVKTSVVRNVSDYLEQRLKEEGAEFTQGSIEYGPGIRVSSDLTIKWDIEGADK